MTSREDAHPLALGFFNTPEQKDPISLDVEGTIPTWLKGALYRGTQGLYDVGNFTSEHWFDGFSRLNRFEIADGKVSYRSRNTTDELIAFVEETGQNPRGVFARDPCKKVYGALETTFRDDSAISEGPSSRNLGVDWIKNWPGLGRTGTAEGPLKNLVSTTDAHELVSLDPETLEPLHSFSYKNYGDGLENAGLSVAHPSHGSDGSLYNYLMLPTSDGGVEYKVFELNPRGKLRVLASITDAPASYVHEVFGTENYVVLIVWQAHIDMEKLNKIDALLDALKPWDKTSESLFYVIDKKKGGVVAKYVTDPFYAFHAIAAYEDKTDGSIVVDLPWMANWDFLEAARVKNLRANVGNLNGNATHDGPGTFRRYRLPNAYHQAQSTQRAILEFELPYKTCNIELPKLNEAYRNKPYRYARQRYGIHLVTRSYFADSLVKIDTHERSSKVYKPTADSLFSEPIFVDRPGGTAEDDGVLLSIGMDSVKRKSYMVVIDASKMEELARANMPMVHDNLSQYLRKVNACLICCI